jgi:hypothetical protein
MIDNLQRKMDGGGGGSGSGSSSAQVSRRPCVSSRPPCSVYSLHSCSLRACIPAAGLGGAARPLAACLGRRRLALCVQAR